jgi:hypothetical protein
MVPAWPPQTTVLRWCPACGVWTVPIFADECRCGERVTKAWDPSRLDIPRRQAVA